MEGKYCSTTEIRLLLAAQVIHNPATEFLSIDIYEARAVTVCVYVDTTDY